MNLQSPENILNNLPIRLVNLTKSYSQISIVKNLSLEIDPGSFYCILGPSGCGKSTLLKLLAGLVQPDSGEILLPSQSRISYVFQDPALLPWLNVRENIFLALASRPNITLKEKQLKLLQVLEMVKLSNQDLLFPHELSGGMKMRVSIARALINDPQILLMDEPFSALDELVRQELQEELWQLWTTKKMTVFFVTHAISEAVFLAQNILLFQNKHIYHHASKFTENRNEFTRSHRGFLDEIAKLTSLVRGHV